MATGLKARILTIAGGTLLLAIVAANLLGGHLFSREYTGALESRSLAVATSLKVQLDRVLQLGIPLQELIGFDEQCREVVQAHQGIAYALVIDPAGKVLFQSGPTHWGMQVETQSLLAAIRDRRRSAAEYYHGGHEDHAVVLPVADAQGQLRAAVMVGFPARQVDAKVRELVIYDAAIGLGVLAAGLAVLLATMGALVTRPLVRLVDTIEALRRNSGDLSRRVAVSSTDEIGRLARSFNGLMQELQNTTVSKRELERTLAVLQEMEERYRRLVESSPTAIFINQGERMVFCNPAGLRLLGAERPEQIYERDALDFVHPDSRPIVMESEQALLHGKPPGQAREVRLVRLDGAVLEVEVTGIPFVYQGQPAVQLVVHDVTEARHKAAQLEHVASHDLLTGLPNRVLLMDRLRQALFRAERSGAMVAVLFLDLDRFKVLNDTQGHAAGDKLLQELARRLEACLRKGDTVARFGGDEFVLLLSELRDAAEVEAMAARALAAISAPIRIGGEEVRMTASIGIALHPQDGATGELLLRNADTAMYRAKELGRNNSQYYTDELNVRLMQRSVMQRELHRALDQGQFVLHYQPQVDLSTGRIAAVEALVRWHHPEMGMVSPASFIPLAEETGLIIPLGAWVLQEACRQAQRWQLAGLRPVRVAVNLSARQLEGNGLEELLAATLTATGLAPDRLELELTETEVMRNPQEMVAKLRRLSDMGVTLAIDDFGIGYSSLSYLKQFPFDRIKIDQSFVRNVTSDPGDAAITRTIIAIAQSLGMAVIAEGVETQGALKYLWRQGCNNVQGFLLSRPLPAAELEALLRHNDSEPFHYGLPTRNTRVLLAVDDDPHVTSALARTLRDENYQVLTANSVAEAFELLATHEVGVVISDQLMPDMRGTEFLSRVKEIYPATVRMVLSGYSNPASIADAINRGAIYRFLSKPWDDRSLHQEICAAFEEYERHKSAAAAT